MTIWGSSAGGRNGLSGAQEYARINNEIADINGGYYQQVRRSYGQSMESNINSTAASSDLGERAIAYSVRAGSSTSAWQATASGAHDNNIRSFVQSVPNGQIVFFCYAHEPEDENGDPLAFRQASSRFCKLVLDEGNPNVVPVFNLMAYTWRTNTRDPDDWNPGVLMTPAERAATMGAIDGYGGDNPSTRTPEWTYTAPYNTIVGQWGFRFGLYEVGVNAGVSGRGTWMLQLEDWVNARDVDVVCWWHSGGEVDQFWIDGATVDAEPATTQTWAGIIGRNQGADIPDVPLPEDPTIPVPITPGPDDSMSNPGNYPWWYSLWQPGVAYDRTELVYKNSGIPAWGDVKVGGNIDLDWTTARYPPTHPDVDAFALDPAPAACSFYLASVVGMSTAGLNFAFYNDGCATPIVSDDGRFDTDVAFLTGWRYSYGTSIVGQNHSYQFQVGRVGFTSLTAFERTNDGGTLGYPWYYAILPYLPDGASLGPTLSEVWTPGVDYATIEGLTIDIESDIITSGEPEIADQNETILVYLTGKDGIPPGQWLYDGTGSDDGAIGYPVQAPGELIATITPGSGTVSVEFTAEQVIARNTGTAEDESDFNARFPLYLIPQTLLGSYPGNVGIYGGGENYAETHWGPAIRVIFRWHLRTPDWRYRYPDPGLTGPGWGSPVSNVDF